MLQLYLDEDAMDDALVKALRVRGVDVLTAFEAGMIERSDEEHLDYATSQGRVLYTFNLADFCRIHAAYQSSPRPHAGIIVGRQKQYSVGEQMRRLLKVIDARSPEQMANHLEFLSAWF
jgi:predicted nuclease of predicted toxin-antitoxin system